jgi:hypothetical protein
VCRERLLLVLYDLNQFVLLLVLFWGYIFHLDTHVCCASIPVPLLAPSDPNSVSRKVILS